MTKRLAGPVTYPGGKGNLVKKILPHIPYTKIYCEPFGGGGSVLINREKSEIEVYNDIDGLLVNLFRVFQSPLKTSKLQRRLDYTLFSRDEFKQAIEILRNKKENSSEITLAWAYFTVMNQCFCGNTVDSVRVSNWSRTFTSDRTRKWNYRINCLGDWLNRLLRVNIDNDCALKVIKYWDSPDTTFYLDPPYVLHTRMKGIYSHEQEDNFHEKLIDLIVSCQGAITLSGYEHPIYNRLDDSGWERFEIETFNFMSRAKSGERSSRTEILWKNPMAIQLLNKPSKNSFFSLFIDENSFDNDEQS